MGKTRGTVSPQEAGRVRVIMNSTRHFPNVAHDTTAEYGMRGSREQNLPKREHRQDFRQLVRS